MWWVQVRVPVAGPTWFLSPMLCTRFPVPPSPRPPTCCAQHTIKAPADGVIERVNYKVGAMVQEKQMLVSFKH